MTVSHPEGYNTLLTEHFRMSGIPSDEFTVPEKGRCMYRFTMILVLVFGMALFGCGEQADEATGDGTVTTDVDDSDDVVDVDDDDDDADVDDVDVDDDDDDQELGDFGFETPDLAVGQWVTYGVSDEDKTVTLSVVAEEEFDGVNCLWIQLEGEDFVAQLLVDPAGLEVAMSGYGDEFGEFLADPADYMRTELAGGDMTQMFMNEDNIQTGMDFIRSLKMIKFDNEGMVMALDLTGVADMIEPYMSDPEILTGSLQMPESGQPDMTEFIAELDNISFMSDEVDIDVAGNSLDAWQFSMSHPEGEIVFILSDDLPILPIARISFVDVSDGDSGYLEVRDFGFDGAVSKIGDPIQVIDASLFLQGALAQAEAMSASAPATP